jgi:hypothetical protein
MKRLDTPPKPRRDTGQVLRGPDRDPGFGQGAPSAGGRPELDSKLDQGPTELGDPGLVIDREERSLDPHRGSDFRRHSPYP